MLQSLTLNGFKSFAKKSELEFGSSVTAIVGPNGSGKSNVVEGFRFVLGEQSMKSMRGKSGSDLIFKGSKSIAKLNRAKASVVFDNSKRIFKLDTDGNNSINLDFEQVEISREVFADGTNKYRINGSEVRLKDIHELLASVHIGSSGHHIISQGQADRLLSANSKDRREMIEDALGLKVYQIKMKNAERKLEKTEQNIKEVESLRREIAPHIRYLKKQVDKIKQAEELREKLGGMYRDYLAKQDSLLSSEYDVLSAAQTRITDSLADLDARLEKFGPSTTPQQNTSLQDKIHAIQNEISELRKVREELSRKVGRIEAMIEMSSQIQNQPAASNAVSVPREDFEMLVRDLNVFLDQTIKSTDLASVQSLASRLQVKVSGFGKYVHQEAQPQTQTNQTSKEELQNQLQGLQTELDGVDDSISQKTQSIQEVE